MEKNKKAYYEIKACLTGKLDIKQALKVHYKYSRNNANKQKMALKPVLRKRLLPVYLTELLEYYRPADIKEEINKVAKQAAKTPKKAAVIPMSVSQKLKKEFPKLDFNSLPENLQLLVIKRYAAWESSKKNYALQQEAKKDAERFINAKATVEDIMENWKIWEELEHYHMYGKPLGKHDSFSADEFKAKITELEKLPAMELAKELAKIRRNKRNAINRLLGQEKKKKKLTEKQRILLKTRIYEFDYVSVKLDEPKWTK